MFNVETNAISRDLLRHAADVLDTQPSISRSGRLGLEVTLPQAQAERLAERLRQSGHEAICTSRDAPRPWRARGG